MKLKYIPALLCLAVFGTLAYFGLTSKQAPAEHNLYAPNLMNRTPTSLPCPPICENRIKSIVQSVDEDTWFVATPLKANDQRMQHVLDQMNRDLPLVWTASDDFSDRQIMR